MIEIMGVTKTYGRQRAVHELTFRVLPGAVTGYLGRNGAGKSTTLRIVVGLAEPTAGLIRVAGRRYADHPAPMREVGALLEARSAHPGRSAAAHLRALAATAGLPGRRVDEVLAEVGLQDVAGRRVGGFSLGMGQRLGIAVALLGDPGVVVLDEPGNGLDPEGLRWLRGLLRRLADQGRTVFVSSHLMAEMAAVADRVVVLGRGRLLADQPTAELVAGSSGESVRVRLPQPARLRGLLGSQGAIVSDHGPDWLEVRGLPSAAIGELACRHSVALHELVPHHRSLEDVFLDMTREAADDAVDDRAAEDNRAAETGGETAE
jgi:ABC-2 type transport system ATP-binding protein